MEDHPVLKFFLFGKPCFKIGQIELSHFDSSRAQELFCYILLNRKKPLSRELLSDLFWGNTSSGRSKKNLRQVLWQLQSTLRIEKQTEVGILEIDGSWVQVNKLADFWLDVAVFENVYATYRTIDAQYLIPQHTEDLCNAVNLYRGDLLEGWYQEWCLFERELLQNMYFDMLEKLMDYCILHQDYTRGIDYGNRILRYDRARERTHRRIMRLYFFAGNRTGALRQYEHCKLTIHEELGVSPSQQTQLLFEQIRDENPDGRLLANGAPLSITEPTSSTAVDLSTRLKQILTELAEVYSQLQEEILIIEHLIGRKQ